MSNHFLPPGPWDSRGNRVVAGNGQTIATIFFPRYASEIARALATYPELAGEIEALKGEIAELKLRLESRRLGVEKEEVDYD